MYTKNIAVCYHLYFTDLIPELIWIFSRFDKSVKKIVSVTPNITDDYINVINKNVPGIEIIRVPNSGRDLRAFVEFTKDGKFDNFDWVLKIHGKKSVHRTDGDHMRLRWTEFLAPEDNPLKLLTDLPKNLANIRLIAPKDCLINPAAPSNWVSNANWVKEILSRYSQKTEFKAPVKEWSFPILAGSFYWISQKGLKFLKNLPVKTEDWKKSENTGLGIDGGLEHAIERLLIGGIGTSKKTVNQNFILSHRLDNETIYEVYDTLVYDKELVKEIYPLQTIPHVNTIKTSKQDSYLAHWSIKTERNRTRVFCLFYSELNKSASNFNLELRVCGKKYKTFQADKLLQELYLPGVCCGQFRAEFELYGEFKIDDIKIAVSGLMAPLVNIPKNLFILAVKRAAFISVQNLSNVLTPEEINLGTLPLSKVVRESTQLPSLYGKKALNFWENRFKLNRTDLHIFIINNSFTALLASRVISNLSIKKENILIIYHRMQSSKLFENYKSVKTPFGDIEINIKETEYKIIYEFTKSLLIEHQVFNFALYSYHYFSLFSSLLAWSPKCVQCNLLEEGNLNSRPAHDFQRVATNKLYEFLPEKISNYDPTTLNTYLYQLAKVQRSNIFKQLELRIPKYVCGENVSLEDTILIDSIQRDYFSHPKMCFGNSYFRLSEAVKKYPLYNDTSIVMLKLLSENELTLINEYKKVFMVNNDRKKIVFAASAGENKDFLTKLFTKHKDKLINLGKFDLIYLKHPASTNTSSAIHDVEKLFKKELKDTFMQLDEAPEGIVSDLFCTQADGLIHYNSSLARSVSSIIPGIKLFKCA